IHIRYLLLALTAAPLLASASPLQLPRAFDSLPSGTHSGSVSSYAHDGTFLGRRADGTCTNLSPDDLKGLEGWSLVTDQAAKNWGNGKYNLATNIDNEANYPATACVIPPALPSTQSSSGTLVGTSGSVALSALEGTSSSTTITTTKTSDWSVGVSVSASISIPDIVDVTTTATTSISITNSLSNALKFTSKSCTGSGKGSIVMVATGWAWFEYSSKVRALNIETAIPDASQRSSSIDFTAALSATNDSNYNGTCTQ
ncbi:hypothetical protein B0H14DRAFT_2830936, partial [Mycena olivaceomarginata]